MCFSILYESWLYCSIYGYCGGCLFHNIYNSLLLFENFIFQGQAHERKISLRYIEDALKGVNME